MDIQFQVRKETQRLIDTGDLTVLSSRDLYTIVQAKSASEPCTRLPEGLYAEPFGPGEEVDETWTVGYAWYIPYNTTESSKYGLI